MVFAMHGMGPNNADLPAMVLLPELLYRHSFGKPLLRETRWAGTLPNGMPLLGEDENWTAALMRALPVETRGDRWTRRARRLLGLGGGRRAKNALTWMPAARYARYWPKMEAFAVPAYYDGRIRLNVEGREAGGNVPRERYEAVRKKIATLVSECRDVLTGEPIAEKIQLPDRDPMDLDVWDSDITVHFHGAPVGFTHPKHGAIGPVPYRRTGGHTGTSGFLYVSGPGIAPHAEMQASAFDVVPTAVDLLGATGLSLSGRSLKPVLQN